MPYSNILANNQTVHVLSCVQSVEPGQRVKLHEAAKALSGQHGHPALVNFHT